MCCATLSKSFVRQKMNSKEIKFEFVIMKFLMLNMKNKLLQVTKFIG